MKKNKTNLLLLFATSIILPGLVKAQDSVNASGGFLTGSGGSISYSVGQLVYTMNTNSAGTVGQGVQQPFEFFPLGIKETESNIILSVFPNPTVDHFILQVNDYTKQNLSFKLSDMQGKLLTDGQITSQRTQINMSNLPAATYFIQVFNTEKEKVQSFKIIKN